MLYNLFVVIAILFHICPADVITYSEIGALEERIENNQDNANENGSSYQEGVLRRRLLPGGFTTSDKLAILNKQNKYRNLTARGLTPRQPSASNMNQLVWDNGLAKVAQDYSAKCIWGHNPNRRYDLNKYLSYTSFDYVNQYVGENLFISTGSESLDTIMRGIDFWYNENPYYTYGTVSGTATCQSGKQCGHYTQLVWANTRYVGCGYTKCATVQNLPTFTNAILFACNYYFAGNYVGDYPYKTGTSCSKCPQDRQTCKDGLCSGCPSRSWDTYCCEYCSSSTCLNSINQGLCNPPSTCTNGITTMEFESDILSNSTTTTQLHN